MSGRRSSVQSEKSDEETSWLYRTDSIPLSLVRTRSRTAQQNVNQNRIGLIQEEDPKPPTTPGDSSSSSTLDLDSKNDSKNTLVGGKPGAVSQQDGTNLVKTQDMPSPVPASTPSTPSSKKEAPPSTAASAAKPKKQKRNLFKSFSSKFSRKSSTGNLTSQNDDNVHDNHQNDLSLRRVATTSNINRTTSSDHDLFEPLKRITSYSVSNSLSRHDRDKDNSDKESEANLKPHSKLKDDTHINNSSITTGTTDGTDNHNSNGSSLPSSPTLGPKKEGFLHFGRKKINHTRPATVTNTPRHFPQLEEQKEKKHEKIVFCKNTTRATCSIKELQNIKPLQHVSFVVDIFDDDPPQQIPSRTPKKGNVEITSKGCIVHKVDAKGLEIHYLIPKTDPSVPYITVPDMSPPSEALKRKFSLRGDIDKPSDDLKPHKVIDDNTDADAAQRHGIAVSAAAAAAEARVKSQLNEQDDEQQHLQENENKDESENENEKPSLEIDTTNNKKEHPNLDLIYTRCCHLREILPINATLKQIKSYTQTPIPLLKLRNTRPSMIEILTFSDFISIVPILNISLDDVSLSSEMLRILLSSLVYSKALNKLSLRNVVFDDEGWDYLCWFLSINKSLERLDLSQVPSDEVIARRLTIREAEDHPDPKKNTSSPPIKRMRADDFSRSDMNWKLFVSVLESRTIGLQELLINGCQILKTEDFKDLLNRGCPNGVKRLGLSNNELSYDQCVELSNWLAKDEVDILGLDLGFNDFSGENLEPLIKTFRKVNESTVVKNSQGSGMIRDLSHHGLDGLKFISLTGTNLNFTKSFIEYFHLLSRLPSLVFLDLSFNPDLFPEIIPTFISFLPQFKQLRRIHFDYNELHSTTITALADVLPLCPKLAHVSFLGNYNMDKKSSAALIAAIKASTSIVTVEIETKNVPPSFLETMNFFCIRNMENFVYNAPGATNDVEDGINDENKDQLTSEFSKLIENPDSLSDAKFVEKALLIQSTLKSTMRSLILLRETNELSIDGKETLLRFYFLNITLGKIITAVREREKLMEDDDHDSKTSTTLTPLRSDSLVGEDVMMLAPSQSTRDKRKAAPIFPEPFPNTLVHFIAGSPKSDEYQSNKHDDSDIVSVQSLEDGSIHIWKSSEAGKHAKQAKEQEIEEGNIHKLGTTYIKNTLKREVSGADLTKLLNNTENMESVDPLAQDISSDQDQEMLSQSSISEVETCPSSVVAPSNHMNLAHLSGDDIKKLLLNTRGLTEVAEMLEQLKSDGVEVKDLFRVDQNQNKNDELTSPITESSSDNEIDDKKSRTTDQPDVSTDGNKNNEKVIDEAYDILIDDMTNNLYL